MTARYPLVLNGTSIEELQSGDTIAGASAFDTGTVLLFAQPTAPSGWTKLTTANDAALRIVSGSTGGNITAGSNFSSVFTSGNTGAFTLSTSEMPSHTHNITAYEWGGSSGPRSCNTTTGSYPGSPSTNATGGGGSHSHSINLSVSYVDLIACSKN